MLLDSCMWVELFLGSEKGKEVEKLLIEKECFTSIVSIGEITNWGLNEGLDYKDLILRIKKLSKIVNIDENIMELAGKMNYERKKKLHNWGMLDSLIYASARIYGLDVLTMDHHFEGLEGAVVWE